ncbi:hypothetical protein BASA83_008198 [Batrachochytrium salamandrivorans]|nr:hypothetical protein BASA83_008198 [Batrachochytrium salamandrivorans]
MFVYIRVAEDITLITHHRIQSINSNPILAYLSISSLYTFIHSSSNMKFNALVVAAMVITSVNARFEQQLPTVHGIMTDRSNKSGSVKDKEHKNSKAVKVQGFLKMRPDLIPPLEQVRARSIELEGAYRNLWGKFVSTECSTEGLEHLSPAEMLSLDYFLDWDFDFGANLMKFGRQYNYR